MAATGKTPILLYGSTTVSNAPVAGNLTNSSDGCEIAINVADKNLFFKDSTNTVNTVPIRQSGTSSNGWLSSTDWNTFNNKVSSQWTTSGSNIYYSGGSVGIDIAPTANTLGRVFQIGQATTITSNYNTNTFWLSSNWTYSGGDKYINNGYSTIYSQQNGEHQFLTSASGTAGNPITYTNVMRLFASGGVSIGNTTDPGAGNLSVNNQIYVGGTSGLLTGRSAFYSNQAGQATFRNTNTASGKYFFVGPDGGNSFLIENQSSTGVYLADGGITWSSVSDIRLKEIIEPIKNAKEKLSTLRTIIGRYKTDNESVRRPFLIAQDVQLVLPEAVSKYTIENHGEEYLGLEYANLIPLIIAAINEISVSITNIEAKIDNLV